MERKERRKWALPRNFPFLNQERCQAWQWRSAAAGLTARDVGSLHAVSAACPRSTDQPAVGGLTQSWIFLTALWWSRRPATLSLPLARVQVLIFCPQSERESSSRSHKNTHLRFPVLLQFAAHTLQPNCCSNNSLPATASLARSCPTFTLKHNRPTQSRLTKTIYLPCPKPPRPPSSTISPNIIHALPGSISPVVVRQLLPSTIAPSKRPGQLPTPRSSADCNSSGPCRRVFPRCYRCAA
jgi:hypothetical protein